MKTPNLIPSQPLSVALPRPLYLKLGAHLYSEFEQRVPHGAYSRFMINLLQGYFHNVALDLAPYADVAPGSCLVSGSPETIALLKKTLGEKFTFGGTDADFAALGSIFGD